MGYGKNIKNRREELGLSQDELAKACGYKSRASISKIESESTDLTQSKLAILAKALKTTPGALCTPDEIVKPTKLDLSGMTKAISHALDEAFDEAIDKSLDEYLDENGRDLMRVVFSKNLSKLMAEDDVSNTTLAKAIGVSNGAVGKWLSGGVLPRPNIQFKIADYFGIDRWDLFVDDEGGDDPGMEVFSYPVVGTIAAGVPILAEQNIDSYIELNIDINADFALRIKGDSMIDANIYDGDIVFIREQPIVENGEIAAVMVIDQDTSDSVATLKRVYRTDDGMMLVAENKNYPPIIVNKDTCDDAKIIGKAVKCITDVR